MAELMDCMVNYFSLNNNGAGEPRRFYSYLVVAGPGPTDEAGVATITTLAIHGGDRPCDYCQNWFFAHAGGPKAALERALFYLDAFHDGRRLHKVVSQFRRTPAEALAGLNQDHLEHRRSDDDDEQRSPAAPGIHRSGRDGQPNGNSTARRGV
jgi:hypothetical protein